MSTNCTPFTTRPSRTSRHAIIRFVSISTPIVAAQHQLPQPSHPHTQSARSPAKHPPSIHSPQARPPAALVAPTADGTPSPHPTALPPPDPSPPTYPPAPDAATPYTPAPLQQASIHIKKASLQLHKVLQNLKPNRTRFLRMKLHPHHILPLNHRRKRPTIFRHRSSPFYNRRAPRVSVVNKSAILHPAQQPRFLPHTLNRIPPHMWRLQLRLVKRGRKALEHS